MVKYATVSSEYISMVDYLPSKQKMRVQIPLFAKKVAMITKIVFVTIKKNYLLKNEFILTILRYK